MSILTLEKEMLEIHSGISIAYVEKKPIMQDMTKPVLLFVPGFTFPAEVFHHQLEDLFDTYRVIAIDPRSHGASTLTKTGNDYLTAEKDLAAFIDKMQLENIVLIGWSFGALATWGYAHTSNAKKLQAHISIDMPPVSMSEDTSVWTEGPITDLSEAYHALTTAEGHNAMMRDYIQHVMIDRDLNESELSWITGLSCQTPHYIASQFFASGLFSNKLIAAQKTEETIPSHFFLANHWTDKATAYLKTAMPKSTTSTLGEHMMFWEYPEEFNRELRTYLLSL